MVSVLPTDIPSLSKGILQPKAFCELANLSDSVEPFTQSIMRLGKTDIQLHCAVPTWSSSSDRCLDLHDLHELRTRFLTFIHNVIRSLRTLGVLATYRLAPSSSPLCFVCAVVAGLESSQVTAKVCDQLMNTTLGKRENILVDLQAGPCLVIV
ncbi:hypothetical protein E4T56_gene838 [Termitomyces sp. T112]|nr:hypothetical protein E4T56_gene838 [Termitomyces sp. T112]KAH0590730.1 hypothetical protein H2248_000857 [Termitomyces sp. 'cryptogamus']